MLDLVYVYSAAQGRSLHQRLPLEQKSQDVIHQPFLYPVNNVAVFLKRIPQLIDFPRRHPPFTVGIPKPDALRLNSVPAPVRPSQKLLHSLETARHHRSFHNPHGGPYVLKSPAFITLV